MTDPEGENRERGTTRKCGVVEPSSGNVLCQSTLGLGPNEGGNDRGAWGFGINGEGARECLNHSQPEKRKVKQKNMSWGWEGRKETLTTN